MHTLEPKHPVLAVFDAGITDIIPLLPGTKRPAITGWQTHQTSRADVNEWIRLGYGFGTRTERFPAIDVDIPREDVVDDIRKELAAILGDQPRRIGQAPKLAVLCRTDVPFKKVIFALIAPDGTPCGKVEILAAGQQLAIHHIHPGTGMPYRWVDGEQEVDVGRIAERGRAALPELTPEIINAKLLSALQRVAGLHGLRIERGGSAAPAGADAVDQLRLRAPSFDAVRAILAEIPNGERYALRDDWIKVGAAIRAAVGPEYDVDGMLLFMEWSHGDQEYAGSTYESLSPPHRIGYEWLRSEARAAGYDTAVEDFDAVPGALALCALPTEADSIVPLPLECERVAALLEAPERPFLAALATWQDTDGDLLKHWDRLEVASTHGDPLSALFRRAVAKARQANLPYDEPRRFALLLEIACASEPAWESCSVQERRIVALAVRTLLAKPSTLMHTGGDSLGDPLISVGAPREYLLAGHIPLRSLSAIVGPPANGKTFVAAALGASVGSERILDELTGKLGSATFAGHEVRRGCALHFCSEDADGVLERRDRWVARNGAAPNYFIFRKVPRLDDLTSAITGVRDAILRTSQQSGLRPELLIFDVTRATFAGNENDSDVMGTVMATAQALVRLFGVCVLFIHHTGKANAEDPRGSSVFLASMDFVGAVTMTGDDIMLKTMKNKGAAVGPPMHWHLCDGVLVDGAGGVPVPRELCIASFAMAIARAVRGLATESRPITRAQLNPVLATDYPALFVDGIKRNTAASRVTKGCTLAVERGWVTETKKGGLYPGPVDHESLAGTSAALEIDA